MEQQSRDLNLLAGFGLEAFRQIEEGSKPSASWVQQKMVEIRKTDQPYGDTLLAILPEIEFLVLGKMLPLPASYPIF